MPHVPTATDTGGHQIRVQPSQLLRPLQRLTFFHPRNKPFFGTARPPAARNAVNGRSFLLNISTSRSGNNPTSTNAVLQKPRTRSWYRTYPSDKISSRSPSTPPTPIVEEEQPTRASVMTTNGGNSITRSSPPSPDGKNAAAAARADISSGSWLENEEAYAHAESCSSDEHFELEGAIARTTPSPIYPKNSGTVGRPARLPRPKTAPSPGQSTPKFSTSTSDTSAFFGFSPLASSQLMTSYSVSPVRAEADSPTKVLANRSEPGNELVDVPSPSHSRPPLSAALPDPSTFADPYPHGISYHHSQVSTPALSSAGTASTRSSAYTNAGSSISGFGFSGDYSHVRIASGDDTDGVPGIMSRPHSSAMPSECEPELTRASNGSSLSSGSRKSQGRVHAMSQMSRMRRAPITRVARSLSQPEESSTMAAHDPVNVRALRTQPSYDTSWQREHEDIVTSDDDYGEADHNYDDDDDREEHPAAAIAVAEEGRGLIVHGEGLPVHSLHVQPGTTHLLVGASNTPNNLPAFLNATLPQISTTLLALDLSANFLASLSPALALCVSLEELNISSNPLRALPEFLSELTSLRLLIADSTGLSTVSGCLASLQKLHILSVRRNKLYSLPSWLCTLPCLESLLVDGNPFQGPWKALVEPLLAKMPITPPYAPATPFTSLLSARSENASSMAAESGNNSDSDDVVDRDEVDAGEVDGDANGVIGERSSALPGEGNSDESTMTLARARILERCVSSPAAQNGNASPEDADSSLALSRTRTAPNQRFHERQRRQRPDGSQTRTWAEDRREHMNFNSAAEFMPSTPNLGPGPRVDLRRMRSADELRLAQQGSLTRQPSSEKVKELPSIQPQTRPGSKVVDGLDFNGDTGGLLQLQKRLAGLNVHGRSESQIASQPALPSSAEGCPEDSVSHVEAADGPPRSRARAMTSIIRPEGSTLEEEYDRSNRQAFGRQKVPDKAGKKWGFLKKMSMGKLRDGSTPPQSRPSTSQGLMHNGSAIGRPLTSFNATVQMETDVPKSGDRSSIAASENLPPPLLSTTSTTLSLSPPSPMPRSSKRRSFLPIDGPPSFSMPMPMPSSTLGTLSTYSSNDNLKEVPQQSVSLTVETSDDALRREEERQREASTRALRSVMAYLKDMHDLTLLAQGNVLSMYGNLAPADRLRRIPTLGETPRILSEVSADSTDSASATTTSSHLRSLDSISMHRSGSLKTLSIATTDSSSSCSEERKCRDDPSKRYMIIREIVETERTYVKNLQDLVDIYVRPAAAYVSGIGNVTSSIKETVLPATERKIVFGGLEALYIFHKDSFLPALEQATAPLLARKDTAVDGESNNQLSTEIAMSVGRTFVAHAAFMKMYSSYINNFENAVSRIRQWVTERPSPSPALTPSSSTAHLSQVTLSMSALTATAVATPSESSAGKSTLTSNQKKRIKTYLKRCRLHPRHSQLNLEGYLLLPVQRIPRYRLLIEDLAKSTLPPTDSFDDPLDRALAEISSLATNMNEGKREAESRRKLVHWQTRIRGKFPSPLVQPHRRLILDGKLTLTRIVRKQTMSFEILDSHGDTSVVAVDCLAPELTPRMLYGVLCNDLFVLCRDPSNGKDPTCHVDLWAVLRLQTMPQPTSIVHGNTLRIVDTKAILYLEAPSTSEAVTWFRAINTHVPAQA